MGCGVLFIFVTTPAHFLSRLIIVTGPDCGKSELLVSSILTDPGLQEVFTPLTLDDDESHPMVNGVCGVAYSHLLAQAPWFRLAGREWVCRRLAEDAMRYRDQAHGVLPVWVHEGLVIDSGQRDKLLGESGYYLLPGGEGVLPLGEHFDAAESGASPLPAAAASEWRGQNIGF
jgi:hypothetical protein